MVSEPFDIARAVADFLAAAEAGVHYPPQWFDRLSLEQAGALQLAILDARVARGDVQVGWKVGLTAKAIQQQFNVHEPVFGYLLQRGLIRSGSTLPGSELMGPGFENEICIQLGRDLEGPGVEAQDVAAAIATLYPAMELIETRGDLTAQLAVAIADNVQQRGFVIGDAVPFDGLDLRTVTVEVSIDGEAVAQGSGDAVLGNPLNSVAWLANHLATHGRKLEAGQYLMAGSLTRQFPLHPGTHAVAQFESLGKVELRIG